jgi:hypothetical protein
VAVGEVAEDEGSEDGAAEIEGGAEAELGVGEGEAVAGLECSGERAAKAAFEAVEEPRDGEGGDDAEMPAGPRETVEAGGDVGEDEDGGSEAGVGCCWLCDAESGGGVQLRLCGNPCLRIETWGTRFTGASGL